MSLSRVTVRAAMSGRVVASHQCESFREFVSRASFAASAARAFAEWERAGFPLPWKGPCLMKYECRATTPGQFKGAAIFEVRFTFLHRGYGVIDETHCSGPCVYWFWAGPHPAYGKIPQPPAVLSGGGRRV